ncbi:FHA domain-containing protein [Oscillatoria laete-virens NRMC-F 0139]|nr:FHA domain-containing protein [Oscillatoria laete-virens]MDL5053674.1 FHA domain-containing protein [Oscillatoria laete-virens NRMC-F 0139]
MPKILVTNTEFKDKEYDLKDESVSIGRMEDNQIELSEASLSSHHALLNRHESGNYLLKDNGSTNGTYLNGEKLTGEKLLKNGDKIRFGQLMCDYHSEIAVEEPAVEPTESSEKKKPGSPPPTSSAPATAATPPGGAAPMTSVAPANFKDLKKDKSPLSVINVILTFVAGLCVAVTLGRLLGFI